MKGEDQLEQVLGRCTIAQEKAKQQILTIIKEQEEQAAAGCRTLHPVLRSIRERITECFPKKALQTAVIALTDKTFPRWEKEEKCCNATIEKRVAEAQGAFLEAWQPWENAIRETDRKVKYLYQDDFFTIVTMHGTTIKTAKQKEKMPANLSDLFLLPSAYVEIEPYVKRRKRPKSGLDAFALRCQEGENMELTMLQRGRSAPMDTPLVIYPDIRRLERELENAMVFYGIEHFRNASLEWLLTANPQVISFLCPALRSLAVCQYPEGNHPNALWNPIGLESNQGRKVVLLRDGDRAFLLRADEEQVVWDELLQAPGKKKSSSYTGYATQALQGLIGRKELCFPESIDIQKASPWIKYPAKKQKSSQTMDLQNELASLNQKIKKGDEVLIIKALFPGGAEKEESDTELCKHERTDEVRDGQIYQVYSAEHGEDGKQNVLVIAGQIYKKTRGRPQLSLCPVSEEQLVNLKWLSSFQIEELLRTQKSDQVQMGDRQIEWRALLPYLKTTLQYVRKRERILAAWMMKIAPKVLEDPAWPANLSAWMMQNDIHNFSPYRMKQFWKSLTDKAKDDAEAGDPKKGKTRRGRGRKKKAVTEKQ